MSDIDELPKYNIEINAFEMGVLMTCVWKDEKARNLVMNLFKRLHELNKQIKRNDGVKLERDGNNVVMTDKIGWTISREMYPWEYEMGVI